MSSTTVDRHGAVDPRAAGAIGSASAGVADLWTRATELACGDLPGMGLLAGDRPCADVEVLAGAVAVVEFELARRMHAATAAGSLPLVGPGAVLAARGWAAPHARRLARAGALAAGHPSLESAWAAGIITSDHVDAIARNVGPLKPDELAAVVEELSPLWGQLSPQAVATFVARVIRLLHPPSDPDPDEAGAHESRSVSFALTSDSVILSGMLPRVEGEAVIAAVEAFAERLRSEADHVPASARRADGLVALVNAAHATGSIPTRGGLPVSVSVTLDTTTSGDRVWTTSRGHTLTEAEARFAACDALVTPILIDHPEACPDTVAELLAASQTGGQGPGSTTSARSGGPGGAGGPGPSAPGIPGAGSRAAGGAGFTAADRIAALATTLLGTRIPVALGRTTRTATPAQRRALAARDRGCIIPGCTIPAEACQTHHVQDWAAGGSTDLPNLALVCWAHHRQVDLGMWTIEPADPDSPAPHPEPGAPPGTPWPANNGAPWTITRTPRTRWRL
ncbi:MAG: HNH endonuclease [Candidatus Nanopelagicales bacterium]|jgi:hypothetical protein|nr:HNH endonuclease [Candidatus Nanopelagicales bacterium]